MPDGLQPSQPPAVSRSSRASLAGTRIGASALLSREERQALEDAALPVRSVHAGTDLVREGEPAEWLFLVVEGWAFRYQTTRDGMRRISALLIPGDTANIDTLTFERAGNAIRALTEVKVRAIARGRASALAAEHSGIAQTFLFSALTDNAILGQATFRLGRLSSRQRLAHLLCELGARLDGEDGNESSFELPVTQVQLADTLGLTAVHLNRTMQHLRTEGLIATENRAVTIPDVNRLHQFGEIDPAYQHMRPTDTERPDSSPDAPL